MDRNKSSNEQKCNYNGKYPEDSGQDFEDNFEDFEECSADSDKYLRNKTSCLFEAFLYFPVFLQIANSVSDIFFNIEDIDFFSFHFQFLLGCKGGRQYNP